MFSRILILLLLSSCSLFKGSEKILESDLQKNLQMIKSEGEGKGRLHIRERQYLFSFESILKENRDWIMAVAIPLHGEEAMIFPDLRNSAPQDPATDSFAMRIDAGIRENIRGSKLKGSDFLAAMRRTLRILLAHKLNLPLNCKAHVCKLDLIEYSVIQDEKTLRIITPFVGHNLVTTASNLTGPFFMNTQFRVISPEKNIDLLTLELFWK